MCLGWVVMGWCQRKAVEVDGGRLDRGCLGIKKGRNNYIVQVGQTGRSCQ